MIKVTVLFPMSLDCQSFLRFNGNFVVCNDKARVCFKKLSEREKKM